MAIRTFDELMARQADAAVAISGAHHSSWNGEVQEDVRPRMSTTTLDGTIYYNADVTDQLRRMFDPSVTRDAETLREMKDAVRVMLQRNAALLSPEGGDYVDAPDGHSPWIDANSADAAFTDAWHLYEVDAYIDELGLEDEELVRGLKEVSFDPELAVEDTARRTDDAIAFAAHLEERTGLPTREVLRRIAIETPNGMMPRAAGMLFEAEGFAELGPEVFERAGSTPDQVREDLRAVLAHEFGERTPSRSAAPAEPLELKELLAEVNNRQPPPGSDLPPPSWTQDSALDQVKATVDGWHQRLGGPESAQPPADALQAVALGAANAQFGAVRPPVPGGLGRRDGVAQHAPPTAPDRDR